MTPPTPHADLGWMAQWTGHGTPEGRWGAVPAPFAPLHGHLLLTLKSHESSLLRPLLGRPQRTREEGLLGPSLTEWSLTQSSGFLQGSQSAHRPPLLCPGILCHEKGLQGPGPLLLRRVWFHALLGGAEKKGQVQGRQVPWPWAGGPQGRPGPLGMRLGSVRAKQSTQVLGPSATFSFSSSRPFYLM